MTPKDDAGAAPKPRTPRPRRRAGIFWLVLAGATSGTGAIQQPDKLIILSTTDVKGKTSPCG